MNPHILGALFKDAIYQVLDNRVFRLLVILILVMVLPTFLIAAREDSLVLFFGWREYFYEDIFMSIGEAFPGKDVANVQFIQTIQRLIVDQIAGTFGIVFAVAATAFFLPRMLEKGAADTVFSKPVSRFALMFSRYVAGLIFVALLAVALVGGMHAGLILNSGYSDPGFLWSALTLIYLFAIVHAFSIAVGVYTRSTVAAILLSLMFFAFSGCVHRGWQIRQMYIEVIGPMEEARRQERDEKPEEEPAALRALSSGVLATLNMLHYSLPKTTDAAVIARTLRRQVENFDKALYDDESRLQVLVPPEGFTKRSVDGSRPHEIARWARAGEDATEAARITVERWDFDERRRQTATKELRQELETAGIEDVGEDREHMASRRADVLTWSTVEGDEMWSHRTFFFDGQGSLIGVSIEGRQALLDEPQTKRALMAFLASFTFAEDEDDDNPFDRFEMQARWGGPLKYNLWFSIGSSLAFAVAMLALGWQRLIRIDF